MIPEYVIELVKNEIRRIDAAIDRCQHREDVVKKCIHCSPRNLCGPCTSIVASEQALRDSYYDDLMICKDFLKEAEADAL